MNSQSHSNIDPHRYTIMVLDKDPALREVLRGHLEKEGFLVLDLENERRAIDLTHKVSVDLVVASIFLPTMTARELANRISMHHLRLKVLFLSDYAKDIVISHGMVPAGAEVVQKPVEPKELLEGVYAALASSTYWYQIAQASRYFTKIGGEPHDQQAPAG